MGKTSVVSRFNVPGRIGWLTMEAPGFLTLLYTMKTLPARHGITDLPWQNKVLASFFVSHCRSEASLCSSSGVRPDALRASAPRNIVLSSTACRGSLPLTRGLAVIARLRMTPDSANAPAR